MHHVFDRYINHMGEGGSIFDLMYYIHWFACTPDCIHSYLFIQNPKQTIIMTQRKVSALCKCGAHSCSPQLALYIDMSICNSAAWLTTASFAKLNLLIQLYPWDALACVPPAVLASFIDHTYQTSHTVFLSRCTWGLVRPCPLEST